jgi:hypothetical protein
MNYVFLCALLTFLVSCASPEIKPAAERWSNDKRPVSERESEPQIAEEEQSPPAYEAPRVVRDARPAPVAAAPAPVARSEKNVEVEKAHAYQINSDRHMTLSALSKAKIVGTVAFVTDFLNKGRSNDDQIYVLEETHLPSGHRITEDGLVIANINTETVSVMCKNKTYWGALQKGSDFDSVIAKVWDLKVPANTKARSADCSSTASIDKSWATLRSPQLAFLLELEQFHHGPVKCEPEVMEPLFKALQQAEPQFSYSNR